MSHRERTESRARRTRRKGKRRRAKGALRRLGLSSKRRRLLPPVADVVPTPDTPALPFVPWRHSFT